MLELYLYEQVLHISLCVVLGYFSSEKDVSAALLAPLHPAAAMVPSCFTAVTESDLVNLKVPEQ